MRRRGFTLLELVLAMALGTVIVGVATALMISVDRADRAIETNGEDAAQLERARLAVSRTAASILMAPGSDPRRLAAREGETEDERTRARRRNRLGMRADDPLPTPRIILAKDEDARGVMTPARTVLDGALLRERMVGSGELGMGVVPQRLEVVLVDPPVPMTIDKFEAARRVLRRNADRSQRVASAGEGAGEGAGDGEAMGDGQGPESAEPDVAVRAFRGAFEMRPEELTDEEVARLNRGEAIRPRWRLEWQPLMPRGMYQQDAEPPKAVRDGPSRVIAHDLVYANWVFFDNGERKTDFVGTWGGDLPAYMELEIETVTGVQVNWMFEIGWAFGPEVPPDLSRIGSGRGGSGPSGNKAGVDLGGPSGSGGGSGGGVGGEGGAGDKSGAVRGGGK